jgi:hypothetical protein
MSEAIEKKQPEQPASPGVLGEKHEVRSPARRRRGYMC